MPPQLLTVTRDGRFGQTTTRVQIAPGFETETRQVATDDDSRLDPLRTSVDSGPPELYVMREPLPRRAGWSDPEWGMVLSPPVMNNELPVELLAWARDE